MIERDAVIKERAIWNPRSLQLLREKRAAQYAQQAVPQILDGTHISFPKIEVSFGLRVLVKSTRIEGRNLLEMIYDPKTRDLALDMAMVALKALNVADVSPAPFSLFSRIYGMGRRLKIALGERLGASILSPAQRATLNLLVPSYLKTREGEKKALVHGDLHAGNLLVNWKTNSLGFVDLEMVHIGKPVTNFAQLWISFHFADPSLGQNLYHRYINQSPAMTDGYFDSDCRAEVALRCYSNLREARKNGNTELEEKARILLGNVLNGTSFERFVLS